MNFNRLIGFTFGVFFVAVFSGWVDMLQGFNEASAIALELPYNRASAKSVYVYFIPFGGVAFLVFPELTASLLSPINRVDRGYILKPVIWQFIGYMLIGLAFIVLWIF